MGFYNTTQVSGTTPLYVTGSVDDYGTCRYYRPSFATSATTACSSFVGYAYLTLPPPVNFTVFPKFVIG